MPRSVATAPPYGSRRTPSTAHASACAVRTRASSISRAPSAARRRAAIRRRAAAAARRARTRSRSRSAASRAGAGRRRSRERRPPGCSRRANHEPRAAGVDQLVGGASTRLSNASHGSPSGAVPRAAAPVRQPVGLGVDLGRRPAAPLADVDLAPARLVAAPGRTSSSSAVSRARARSRAENALRREAREVDRAPECDGLFAPRSDSGGSNCPCRRSSAFQVDSP